MYNAIGMDPDFEVTAKKIEKPFSSNPQDGFDWICKSLGFMEPIDKGKVAVTIFRELVRATQEGRPLSSAQIVSLVKMSRGSVLHHLNRLQRSGLIVKRGRYYAARSKSMLRTIEEIEQDASGVFSKLKKTAAEIDKELGISGK